MKFEKFIGNKRLKDQISALIDNGRLPHAIIIEGETGLGKRTLAREIAAGLVCRGEEKPCYSCSQCKKCVEKCHPDIYEYSAEGGPRSFHVDVIRDVKNDVYVSPNEAPYKVYILGNCQCMSESAQNAILKVLEEPPEYAVFILTVDSKASLLPTVISRSAVFSVSEVDNSLGADYITKALESADYNTALSSVSAWNGNIGKAIESLNDGKIFKSVEIAGNICYALMKENEFDLMCACGEFEKNRQLLINVCEHLGYIFRDSLMLKDGVCDIISGQEEVAKALEKSFSKQKLLALLNTTEEIRKETAMNASNALMITKICYAFRQAIGR